MRSGGRPEAWCALGTAIAFGLFHGLWDFSVFLDEDFGRGVLHDLTLPAIAIVVIATATAAVVLVERERTGAAAATR